MITVFSGYNQRAVIAFLRTLEKNNLKYQIIASGPDDQIFLTSYSSRVLYTRKVKALDLDDITVDLQQALSKNKNNLIAPSTESLNRFLLKHRKHFEQLGFTIPLVDAKTYAQISDKDSFTKICRSHNISVPREFPLPSTFKNPLVAKPRAYIGSDGQPHPPIFILNESSRRDFTHHYNPDDFTFQEYLEGGRCIYLLFYFDQHGTPSVFSQENYLQQPNGGSMQCAKTSPHHQDPNIVTPYIQLFNKLNFRGMVMVELRLIGDTCYMIEANPRFWGPSQLFCDADYNFFEFLLSDYDLLKAPPKNASPKSTYYFWSNGVPSSMLLKNGLIPHGNGKKVIQRNLGSFVQADIYSRPDTHKIYAAEHLKWLYGQTSKHSQYQVLPSALSPIIHTNPPAKPRYEKERFDYIRERINLKSKHLLDIGGNTGFFTIQSISDGAKRVDYYEGNRWHAEFVQTACQILDLQQKVSVFPKYYIFNHNPNPQKYDLIYNLNVLHHLGDDFDSGKSKSQAKKDILVNLNAMASLTNIIVFQLGFNWKGNPRECLFQNGTKQELIDYIKKGTKNFWRIKHIGIATKDSTGNVTYNDLDNNNIERQDALGEFLNRPLFIMESLKNG